MLQEIVSIFSTRVPLIAPVCYIGIQIANFHIHPINHPEGCSPGTSSSTGTAQSKKKTQLHPHINRCSKRPPLRDTYSSCVFHHSYFDPLRHLRRMFTTFISDYYYKVFMDLIFFSTLKSR